MRTPSRRTGTWSACWLWASAAACAGPGVTEVEPTPAPAAPAAAPAAMAPALLAPLAPPASPASPAPPAPPRPGRDPRSFVACGSDAECGWDDPCQPTRCVEAGITGACDESTPPPGACLCLAGACTLKPDRPPEPTGTCEPRACELDRAGGRCVADDGGVPGSLRSRDPVDVGPSCDCITPAKGCTFTWFEPVPCASVRDCWVSPSPRRHPIARPKEFRGRDFKPCADGEAPPRCSDGVCVVGPAYSC